MNEKDSQFAQSLPVGVVQLLQRIQGRTTVSYRRQAQISADQLVFVDYQWHLEAKRTHRFYTQVDLRRSCIECRMEAPSSSLFLRSEARRLLAGLRLLLSEPRHPKTRQAAPVDLLGRKIR